MSRQDYGRRNELPYCHTATVAGDVAFGATEELFLSFGSFICLNAVALRLTGTVGVVGGGGVAYSRLSLLASALK